MKYFMVGVYTLKDGTTEFNKMPMEKVFELAARDNPGFYQNLNALAPSELETMLKQIAIIYPSFEDTPKWPRAVKQEYYVVNEAGERI